MPATWPWMSEMVGVALLALDLQHPLHPTVVEHALGVAQVPHDQPRIQLGRRHDGLLHVLVNRRLPGGDEASPHVHAVRAQRQRGHQAAPIGHPARGDEGNLQLLGRARQEDEVGHVVLPRVPAALESVHAHGVAADGLRLERMPDRGALVDHLDPGGLQRGQVRFGIAAGGLDDLHPAFDDRADVLGIGRRSERGQEGQVHAEGPVGHLAATPDLPREQLRRLLRQPGDDPEASGVGNGRRQLGQADEVHAALDDGVSDSQQLGDARLHLAESGEAPKGPPLSRSPQSSSRSSSRPWCLGLRQSKLAASSVLPLPS
jgi:hypothetical protein